MPSVEDGSFDDLLGDPVSTKEKADLADLKDGGEPSETPEQLRIRELENQIAKFSALAEEKAAAEAKSPQEKEIEHRKAIQATARFNSSQESFEAVEDDDPDLIVFHVLQSGFTFAGKVWWVGQTVKVKRGGLAYEATVDRNGASFLDDLSPATQRARYNGKIVLGEGPWTGPSFNDGVSKLDAFRKDAAPVVIIN